MNNVLKLGDTVTGTYCDVRVTGTIVAYDGSGYVYVEPSERTEIFGSVRDRIAFDPWARKGLKLVKSGPELTAADVVEHPYNVLGGASLRRTAVAS
jgi:hypothetical protein